MVLVQPPHTSSKLQRKALAHWVYWDKSDWEEYNIDASVILRSGETKNLKNPSSRRKFEKKGEAIKNVPLISVQNKKVIFCLFSFQWWDLLTKRIYLFITFPKGFLPCKK